MHTLRFLAFAVPAIAAVASFTTPATAGDAIQHETKFVMALSGIPVGKMAFKLVLNNGTYNLRGKGSAYGISRIISDATGWTQSSGKYNASNIVAASHTSQYLSKKDRGSINLRFKKGSVVSARTVPAPRKRADEVKVEKAHLASVLDPASTSIIAVKRGDVGNGSAICNRTVPIYDGKNRYDLKMAFKGTRKIVTRGFKGLSYVCSARYVPVSGHRPKKRHIQRLMKNKSIEIALARVGKTSIYSLIQFSIKTEYGKVVGKPYYFKSRSL